MPEPSRQREREFLPSANQALAELEAATGKPVLVLEAPELGVLATIRRAGPEDAGHLRTLGQLYLMRDDPAAALPHLRAATTVAPEDPINLFTYAQCLLAQEGESHEAEADELFHRALRLAPVGELAEKIKNQQRRLADRVMRTNAQGKPRLDAVMYMTSALEIYRALDPAGQKQLLAEAAALGQKGLTINDPSQEHHLRHYKGGRTVSALQAACILYVGIQLLLPGEDAGIDLGREYEMARGVVGGGDKGG
jgi:tetratricopeptide (TPR) repeat protein